MNEPTQKPDAAASEREPNKAPSLLERLRIAEIDLLIARSELEEERRHAEAGHKKWRDIAHSAVREMAAANLESDAALRLLLPFRGVADTKVAAEIDALAARCARREEGL